MALSRAAGLALASTLGLAATLGIAGCTNTPGPQPSPSLSQATALCAQTKDTTSDGMLEMAKVWPKSTSDMHGYQLTTFDQAACSADANLTRPAPADCDGYFPWIASTPQQVQAILGSNGVSAMYQAVVSGDDPVPTGQTINPQEIREVVLTMRGSHAIAGHPVAKAGQFCGTSVDGLAYPAYRLTVHSADTGSDITGLMIIAKSTLIWLEFDQPGWTDQARLRAAKLAIAARPFL
ncbi:hypothetical protein [Actinoplanes regularis]|uniref:PknH-like extracellular domain-containing protein n=1 Tax=Actinoplanes regularis TaxID=52697 RepID=A0A239AYD4_9ACTN|nr:hypothetical protein [Actinoplanes regularis]GIE87282.1 hypothetical protein Are01nite_37620 [Actinoplanes regularis]SNS00509.1 hypothetical protein SAMN06264365_108200 [Actinoplanes regularis]